jgi:hypothetical protein
MMSVMIMRDEFLSTTLVLKPVRGSAHSVTLPDDQDTSELATNVLTRSESVRVKSSRREASTR